MQIDGEGHIVVSPRQICDGLGDVARLINDVLIPGTPLAFGTYGSYCSFLNASSTTFGIHPRNLLVRGSTKVGFSLAPYPEKIWVAMRPDSDLDLAIVDSDYYHYLDFVRSECGSGIL